MALGISRDLRKSASFIKTNVPVAHDCKTAVRDGDHLSLKSDGTVCLVEQEDGTLFAFCSNCDTAIGTGTHELASHMWARSVIATVTERTK